MIKNGNTLLGRLTHLTGKANLRHRFRSHLISSGTVSQKGIIVLGMHRSGTSCLTGILREAGVYLGNVSRKNPYNARGNHEGNATLINDQLLSVNGCDWQQPRQCQSAPEDILFKMERLIVELKWHASRAPSKYWGMKDPRMLFCLDAWGIDKVQFIGTFRNPNRVASSLQHRDSDSGTTLLHADPLKIWETYNKRLLELYEQAPFPILNFDWPPERYSRVVNAYLQSINLPAAADKFFDKSLVHQKTGDEIQDVELKNIYSKLTNIAELEATKLDVS